ncbi:MAG TPA: VWA domain-containing protein [Solirubrobacteraceae bacterium]|nr:VWA domain-containing protein [Solirubrobacteraceae bacterium]
MRRLGTLLACIATSLAAITPAAHAAGARLAASSGTFPLRSFVLTLPTRAAADPSAVRVLENGQPVQRLTVTPANNRFAVMLVIDASTSMRGAPIKGAMTAARAFAAQRPAAQSLGVVTFNVVPTVLAKPTSDGNSLSTALAPTPALTRGTHIYDALKTTLAQIDPAKYDAAAVVVLSDGHDYGSTATPSEIAALARRVHARLFTVGLRSSLYDPSTLRAIAAHGSGEYLGAASPTALERIYRELGDQLANAYVVRYLSTAPADAPVQVTASASGESASTTYTAPRLRIPGAEAAALRKTGKPHDGFLATRTGSLLVAIAVLALVLFGLGGFLRERASRLALRNRISAYGESDPAIASEPVPIHHQHRPTSRRWAQLEEALDIGRVDLSAGRFVLYSAIGTVLLVLISIVAFHNGFLAAVCVVAGPAIARAILRRRVARQRRLFADQLGDSIQAVTSSMRTGHSFVGALAQLVETAQEPTASEFRRLVADERLGVPLERALESVVRRMDNRDLQQVGLVSVIQRETGGNGAEALDRVVGNIRGRDDIRRLVRSLTAQGRLSQSVLTALPVGTALVLKFFGGEAMDPLFKTTWGHALLALAAAMCAAGGFWIGRIVSIKV